MIGGVQTGPDGKLEVAGVPEGYRIMALRVCNQCGSKSYEEECPACLGAGRGSVRDYHYEFEEGEALTAAAPASDGEDVVAEGDSAGPEAADDSTEAEDAYDESHEDESGVLTEADLDQHSRNRLSQMARERGLDPSGTKPDLVSRILGDVQG